MSKKKSKETWLNEAIQVHGELFNYDINNWPDDMNRSSKVEIICSTHGPFFQRISDHVIKKSGCKKCSMKKVAKGNSKDASYYYALFIEKHGEKYTYPMSEWGEVVNNRCKIKAICKVHGSFEIQINNHANGAGCPSCGVSSRSAKRAHTVDDWLSIFNEVHSSKYTYPIHEWSDIKNMTAKVPVICHEHGVFTTTLNQHQRGHGCPSCVGRIFDTAYVNLIENGCLKFGVTSNIKARLNRMNSLNKLSSKNIIIWKFTDQTKPIIAESEIKTLIETGAVSKHLMRDGHSETCRVEYLDTIIEIFEKHGGKRINE